MSAVRDDHGFPRRHMPEQIAGAGAQASTVATYPLSFSHLA
ncbi:MAG TPA: hypothetical protein VN931_00910 [Fibrobacteria bacterium]|nr:hypothetical protein [Fibrobacteria bacterium]